MTENAQITRGSFNTADARDSISKGVNNNGVIYFEKARWNYYCLARDRHELNSMVELNFQRKTWITSGGSRNL